MGEWIPSPEILKGILVTTVKLHVNVIFAELGAAP
jgi:hypothetical protein